MKVIHDCLDADCLIGWLHKEIVVVIAAPGEPVQRLQRELRWIFTGDVHLVDGLLILRPEARDNLRVQVDVIREVQKASVRAEAGIAVVDLQPPGEAFLFALLHERNDRLFLKRANAQQPVLNCDAITAVTDHVLKAKTAHDVFCHEVRTPCGNGQEMPVFPQLPKGFLCRLRDIPMLIAAGHERTVYIKEQIAFSHLKWMPPGVIQRVRRPFSQSGCHIR